MQSEYDDVKAALRIYHDIPAMIANEWATIRNCEAQRESIGATAAQIREVTVIRSGKYLDKTADLATKDSETLFQQEIADRLAHIEELRRTREWIRRGLACMDTKQQYILSLAYIGPTDAVQRRTWRGKSWKEIAKELKYSSATVRRYANRALNKIKVIDI